MDFAAHPFTALPAQLSNKELRDHLRESEAAMAKLPPAQRRPSEPSFGLLRTRIKTLSSELTLRKLLR